MPRWFLLLQTNPKSRCRYWNKWIWFNLPGIMCKNCWIGMEWISWKAVSDTKPKFSEQLKPVSDIKFIYKLNAIFWLAFLLFRRDFFLIQIEQKERHNHVVWTLVGSSPSAYREFWRRFLIAGFGYGASSSFKPHFYFRHAARFTADNPGLSILERHYI